MFLSFSVDNAITKLCPHTRDIELRERLLLDDLDISATISCTSKLSNSSVNLYKCNSGNILGLKEVRNPISCLDPEIVDPLLLSNDSVDLSALKTVLAITPTYKRATQKLDLVSLCHTIMHVPNFLWIVIEDSKEKTNLVMNVLRRCEVNSVHLNAVTSRMTKRAAQRGVEQRNAGLNWIRKHCHDNCRDHCSAVVYFMDDDNKYDLRLFHEVRFSCVCVCVCGDGGGGRGRGEE